MRCRTTSRHMRRTTWDHAGTRPLGDTWYCGGSPSGNAPLPFSPKRPHPNSRFSWACASKETMRIQCVRNSISIQNYSNWENTKTNIWNYLNIIAMLRVTSMEGEIQNENILYEWHTWLCNISTALTRCKNAPYTKVYFIFRVLSKCLVQHALQNFSYI